MKSHPLHHPKPHFLLIWATLFFCCCIPLSTAQKHIEITRVPFQDSLQMSASNPRFYRLSLTNAPNDLDLLISVLPEGKSCTPKLFVSKTKEFPKTKNDADYSSTSGSGNILLISHKDLKEALFIGLDSGDSLCYTKISVEWTKEMKTTANEEKAIKNSNGLNPARSAIVRLAIPKERDIERIVIHVDAITTSKTELPSLEVFINPGKSIPFTDKAGSISRKGSWFEGNTIIIGKDSSLFCDDCTYTLNLRFTESSSIGVQALTFKKNAQIHRIPVLDAVREGMKNTFCFHKKEDFVLSVKVHQGRVGVIVNCDKHRQSSRGSGWDEVIQDSKEITFGQNGYSKCSTGDYFFLVEGEEFSVYSLRVVERKSNQLLLGRTTLVHNEISPKEKIVHELLVPLYLAEEEVLLELHSKQQSVDLDIDLCRFPTDCPGLLPASSSFQITNYYGSDNLSVDKFTDDSSEEIPSEGRLIKFSPQKSGCYPILVQDNTPIQSPTPVCAYLITLSLSKEQASPVKFTLSAEFTGPKLLGTSQSYYDVVVKNTTIYYTLPIPNRNAEFVQLQFTRFFGDFDIFISNSTKYPNHQDSTDFQVFHKDLFTIRGAPLLSEVYYVGIHAFKTSSFSLSAIFSSKKPESWNMNRAHWDITEDRAFSLSPGKPQKGFFLRNDLLHQMKKYYKILLNQGDDWEGTLCITVNSPTKVHFAVNNNGKAPSYDDTMWQTRNYQLEIPSSDPKFLKQGVYYIDVSLARDLEDPELPYDLTHYITYTIKDKLPRPVHTFLSPKTFSNGTITKGESRYFESLLLDDDSPLTIHKSGNIDLYISTDPQNKYPDQHSYTVKTTKDEITLTSSEVCKIENVLGCSVYITGILAGEASSHYSLSVESASAAIALEEGHEIELLTPINNRSALFYYRPSPSQSSVITISCPGREVVIYAKRTKLDLESLDQLWRESSDETTAEYTSYSNALSVPRLGDSSLAIAVYFKDAEGPQTTYKIMATSQIAYFFTDTPKTGEIKNDHYQYFKLKILMAKCTLLFSLTANDEVGLVISHGEDTRPTLSNHQFASISHSKTHILEINNTDLSPSGSMLGYWVIGVCGHTSASFTLKAAFEDHKMLELKPGIPVEMSLQWRSVVYLRYFHEAERHLQINLTQLSGEMTLYATDLVKELPDKNHYKWRILNSDPKRALTIPMQDHKACVSCFYIIRIEAVSYNSKFSLVVNQLEDILPIQNLFLYSGLLKAQRSAIYIMLNGTQGAQLNIEISGEKLIVSGSNSSLTTTNYLWKTTLTSNQTISLTQTDSYILLHNPTGKDIDFSFMITPKITPISTLEYIYHLDPYQKKFFEFTVPEDAVETKETFNGYSGVVYLQAEVDIVLYAAIEKNQSIESYFQKGQKVQAFRLPQESTTFPQESTTEPKDYTFQAESAPTTKHNESHAIVEQRFSGKMNWFDTLDKQKYLIEIANPWEFPVEFRLDIGIPLPTHTVIPQAEQWVGNLGSYEMPLKTSGNWYFWVYSCDATIDLKVEHGDPETAMVTIPKGGSYLYRETIAESGNKSFVVRANKDSEEKKGKFIMYSSLVNEETFKNYDVKKGPLEIQVSYKPHEKNIQQNNITVQFEPVEFTEDLESSDEVIYQVKLCPERAQQYAEAKFCLHDETCLDSEVRLSVDHKEMLTVDFQRIRQGKYSVRVKATIIHKNQQIKFVQPYIMSFIDIKTVEVEKPDLVVLVEEDKPVFWRIVVGIVALGLVVVAGLAGFKKVRGSQKDKGGDDLQRAPDSSTKGFQPLENEEGDNEASQIERNGI